MLTNHNQVTQETKLLGLAMFVRFLCVLLSPCLAYNQTIGLQLAYLEKAVYCGQEAFDKWQAGQIRSNLGHCQPRRDLLEGVQFSFIRSMTHDDS